jgi:hypothetical protein
MIPGASLASTVLADKGGKVSDSGNVQQSISQSNSVSASNSGSGGSASTSDNSQSIASVDIHNHGGGKVKDSGNAYYKPSVKATRSQQQILLRVVAQLQMTILNPIVQPTLQA